MTFPPVFAGHGAATVDAAPFQPRLMLLGPTMDPKTAFTVSMRLPHLPLRITLHAADAHHPLAEAALHPVEAAARPRPPRRLQTVDVLHL